MHRFDHMELTDIGRQMVSQTKASGGRLNLTRFAVGDGDLKPGEKPADKNSLSHERAQAEVTRVAKNNGQAKALAYLDNRGISQGNGFAVREGGIYATGADGVERLLAYQYIGFNAESIPDLSEPVTERGLLAASLSLDETGDVVEEEMVHREGGDDADTLTAQEVGDLIGDVFNN